MIAKLKPKKCRICKDEYQPANTLQRVCSPKCAIDLAAQDRAKKEREAEKHKRAQIRKAKERIKTRGQWLKEAQQAFNRFIRERDHGKPCISCGVLEVDMADSLTGGAFDCGHYRSTGSAPELRFEETNAHGQCKRCNRNLSGNVVMYRVSLVQRIGQKAVDWIEGPHPERKYTICELKEIKAKYNKMANDLRRKRLA